MGKIITDSRGLLEKQKQNNCNVVLIVLPRYFCHNESHYPFKEKYTMRSPMDHWVGEKIWDHARTHSEFTSVRCGCFPNK